MATARVDVLVHGTTPTPAVAQPPRVQAATSIPLVTVGTSTPGSFPDTTLFPLITLFPGP